MMMLKISRNLLLGVLMICVLISASFVTAASLTAKNPMVVKLGVVDPATIKVGDTEIYTPAWAGMLAFQSAMKKYSKGKVKVELYANGRLGDNKSMIEQVLNGNLLMATGAEGSVAPFYKQIQVLSVPYVFKDVITLWKVMDGPFGRKFFNDMATKSGVRVLTAYHAGGFRCFANNKRVIKVPADMKGLKMRVMESPIYMEVVKACDAVPTPIAWMELYSALQTGVVDGMENGSINILSGSFYEVQKYYTLDNHVPSIGIFFTSEKFFKNLPSNLRKVFIKAGEKASIAGRDMADRGNSLALEELKKKGMKVYVPTSAERKLWEETRKPVFTWFRKTVDSKLLDELLKAVKKQSPGKK
jgi:tripartite ATP-independent transporter DctP family solute receptor